MRSLLLFVACWLLAVVSASIEFEVERIAQYAHKGTQFGPQRMGAAGVLATTSSDSLRRVELVSIECLAARVSAAELHESEDADAFSRTVVGGAAAVVVLLPSPLDADAASEWRRIESVLLRHSLQAPVFVTRNATVVEQLGFSCNSPSASNAAGTRPRGGGFGFNLLRDDLYATIAAAEAQPIKPWRATNVLARLPAADQSAPTIAIIASYDGLHGAAKQASAAVAVLLQAARLLARLRSAPQSESLFQIVFVAAAGGPANFAGTAEWLRTNTAEFAICIDSIDTTLNQTLLLRASRPLRDENARLFYETFGTVAGALGLTVEQKIEKVNLDSETVQWEHEHFSRARLLAATLTTRSEALKSPVRGSLADEIGDVQMIRRTAVLVAEVVARLAYDRTSLPADAQLIEAEGIDDEAFVKAWIAAGQSASPGNSSLATIIRSLLNATIEDVSSAEFLVDVNVWQFYSQRAATVIVHTTKPYGFDFVLMIVVLVYLLVLHVALRGPTAINQLRSLWSR